MSKRINEKVEISFDQISHIFNQALNIKVVTTSFMKDGSSTTNYKVVTTQGTFLLKLYSAHLDNHTEIHLMTSLEENINVPKVHFYDFSRRLFPTDFLMSDFIEGSTFRMYVKEHGMSKKHAYQIGKTLSLIHNKTYDHPQLFDQKNSPVKSIVEQYNIFIKSIAGKHIGEKYCEYLKEILIKNKRELAQVNKLTVRSHGDLNPDNILVDKNDELWFIDFEYGHATSPYLDFGKFLRKRYDYSHHIKADLLDALKKGYNASLASNWVHLSMLVDMPAMLRLIDKEEPNKWRVDYIQRRIKDLHEDLDKVSYTYKDDHYKT